MIRRSHNSPLSGRDGRGRRATWQKRSGREGMGQRAKVAHLCCLPQIKGWQERKSAGYRERLKKIDGISREGDEHERAYEIICIADESG